MRSRSVRLASSVALAATMATVAAAQAPRPASAAAARPATVPSNPRTADGHPDFTGTYDLATLTPVERPANVGGRATYTEQEVQQMIRQEQARRARGSLPSNPNRSAPPVGGNQAAANSAGGAVGGYNGFWIDRGDSVMKIDNEY